MIYKNIFIFYDDDSVINLSDVISQKNACLLSKKKQN